MTTTAKTTKTMKHPCGFCATEHHENCPGGILNGDQTTVVLCPCECDTPKVRCFDCGNRDDVNTATWTCEDSVGCDARVEKSREKSLRDLFGDAPAPSTPKTPQVKEDRTAAPRTPKGGKCLCCGEATKGGLFLPGHDSRYLAHITRNIAGGEGTPHTLEEWVTKMQEYGCSDVLQAKLRKRVEK